MNHKELVRFIVADKIGFTQEAVCAVVLETKMGKPPRKCLG